MAAICNMWYRVWATDCGEWTRPLSRVLILLTTLLLMVMPVTEYLCNWDRFLRGGPDVEFSVLAWLLFAAMIVLSMHGTILQPLATHPDSMRSSVGPTIARDRVKAGFASRSSLNSQTSAADVWRLQLIEAGAASEFCLAIPMRI